ncbi:MAG: DUF3098 domain-containing protein [Bacteroidales bacterium]
MAKAKDQKGKKAQKGTQNTKLQSIKHEDFTFGKQSYRLLILGLILIALGFILMSGGGTDDPNVFNNDIFSHRRITAGPILVLAGYVVEIFAIMKRPSSKTEHKQ